MHDAVSMMDYMRCNTIPYERSEAAAVLQYCPETAFSCQRCFQSKGTNQECHWSIAAIDHSGPLLEYVVTCNSDYQKESHCFRNMHSRVTENLWLPV
jgi:hypothetical protein